MEAKEEAGELARALGWPAKQAHWTRLRWASSINHGENAYRWVLTWRDKRAEFGELKWAGRTTDPTVAIALALGDIMPFLSRDEVDALVTIPWIYVLGGFWAGARVMDTGDSAQRGWVGTIVRTAPDKVPQGGLRSAWEVPPYEDEEDMGAWSITSITAGSALLLDEDLAKEGLAGNVAELSNRIAKKLGLNASSFAPPRFKRRRFQTKDRRSCPLDHPDWAESYWQVDGLHGLIVHDHSDLDRSVLTRDFNGIRIKGVGEAKTVPEFLRVMSLHFAVVPPNLEHLVKYFPRK